MVTEVPTRSISVANITAMIDQSGTDPEYVYQGGWLHGLRARSGGLVVC